MPYVIEKWCADNPGQQIPDGHVFTQPWPAGPTDQRKDQVYYYQYKHDRARRTLRGIDEQVSKAEKAVARADPGQTQPVRPVDRCDQEREPRVGSQSTGIGRDQGLRHQHR